MTTTTQEGATVQPARIVTTQPPLRIVAGAGATDDGPALVAAGIPVSPPRSWFEHRDFPDGTPLTFTTDGQVYGRLANRNVAHVGMPGNPTYAPYSSTGFAYYHLGAVRCDDGTIVNTGPVTLGGGHADGHLTADAARAVYDDANSGIADVVAFDRPDGVYCAGAARPGVTPEKMRVAMASPASGDWRPVREKGQWLPGPEFIAAHCVSVPGFPSRRSDGVPIAASAATVDDAAPLALVASAGSQSRIVITASSASTPPPEATDPSTPEETAMPDKPTTTEPEPVTAAAPAIAKGEPTPNVDTSGEAEQVAEGSPVGVPDGQTGVVTEVDENQVASVLIQVPLSDLKMADEQAVMASAAGIKARVKEAALDARLRGMEDLMAKQHESLTAALEQSEKRANAAEVSSDLDHILASAEGNG